MARKENILQRSKKKKAKVLLQQGKFVQARQLLDHLTRSGGGDPEIWFLLGAIYGRMGESGRAIEYCTKALDLKPDYAAAQYNLAIALRENGQLEEAVNAFKRTLNLNPDHKEAVSALGNTLVSLGRFEEAETIFLTGLKQRPDDPDFFACLGSAMQTMGRYEAAVSAYKKAIAYRIPELAEVYDNLGTVFCQQGKYRESLEYYQKALVEKPGDARIHSNILLTMHYSSEWSEADIYQEHRKWPGNDNAGSVPASGDLDRKHQDGRRIRVGYVSSDFREHSVTYFIEPLLEQHDHQTFEIFAYHNSERVDYVTRRLRSLTDHWRNVEKMSDKQLFDQVQADEIDILVDLNGHTSGHRLKTFAMKPAPVQVNYLGYPNTTGLRAMDYRFTSDVADPEGSEAYCTETFWRLGETFLCYRAPDTAPPVSESPAAKNGFVTFGSFNNLAKINPEVVELWAGILHRQKTARLLIKNPSLTDEATQQRYLGLFEEYGVKRERIDLVGFARTTAEHLEMYSKIDIALDTFPYSGTTTTCEALWMGVPVVTLTGPSHRARVGASLLTALGQPEWIAGTKEAYLSIANDLSANTPGLASLRAGLREGMLASNLCDTEGLVSRIETAYSSMWDDYLRGSVSGNPAAEAKG